MTSSDAPGSKRSDSDNSSSSARVALIDDHSAIKLALGLLIENQHGLELAGSASSVTEHLKRHSRADLVVLDLRLSDGSSSLDNITRLRRSGASVLVVTSGENPYLMRSAAKADVMGIVRKSSSQADILNAIVVASTGSFVFSSDWAAAVDGDPHLEWAKLSQREKQVLELYAGGASALDVAAQLHVSPHTVQSHLKRIRMLYTGLNREASSRLDLFHRAIEDGVLPFPEHIR